MRRTLHALIGLVLGLPLVFVAVTGTFLALKPMIDRLAATPADASVTAADLAARVLAAHPDAESIVRKPSGVVVVAHFADGEPVETRFDPLLGADLGPYEQPAVFLVLADLHRSFGTGDATAGRLASGLAAAALALLLASGAVLLHHRAGGWRAALRPIVGTPLQRAHILVARSGALLLAVVAATGLYLTFAFLGLVDDGMSAWPDLPPVSEGTDPVPIGDMAALKSVPLDALRRVVLPFDGDPAEPVELVTTAGAGYVDQSTGELATWIEHGPARRVYETVLLLHGGEGLWWFALLTGLASASIPVLAATGTALWWRRRKALPTARRTLPVENADTVILVGSENNATFGFAGALEDALVATGLRVHVAPMNRFGPAHAKARRILILTATYGDGTAPASASAFLDRLVAVDIVPAEGVAVLGFGDRRFGHYCGYAEQVEAAIRAKGWPVLAPFATVNRQSAQDFARWGESVGRAIGITLDLVHVAEPPETRDFQLLSRRDHADETGAPVAVLRFVPVARSHSLWRRLLDGRDLPPFQAADLLFVLPPDSALPRAYSLASAESDGFMEIAVRKVPGGLCSGYLHDLAVGERIRASVKLSPALRLPAGRAPAILVGGGCGVGPLAGIIRANSDRRPMRLYFGARTPVGDHLYRRELEAWQTDGRLQDLVTAFSPAGEPSLLPRTILADSALIASEIDAGGVVLVVGGREMADAVAAAMDDLLAGRHTVAALRAEGRYVEDVF